MQIVSQGALHQVRAGRHFGLELSRAEQVQLRFGMSCSSQAPKTDPEYGAGDQIRSYLRATSCLESELRDTLPGLHPEEAAMLRLL